MDGVFCAEITKEDSKFIEPSARLLDEEAPPNICVWVTATEVGMETEI